MPKEKSDTTEFCASENTLKWNFNLNLPASGLIGPCAGEVVEYSKNYVGSRVVQTLLAAGEDNNRNMIINELLSDSTRLAMHVCGNYAIQKALQVCGPLAFQSFLKTFSGNMETMAVNVYGWRIVQTAVDYSSTEQQLSILAELHGNLFRIAQNRYGSRVIRRILESGHACQVSIFENLKGKFSALAKQLFGCRFVQHALDCFPVELWRSVADELVSETVALVQDSYGNYVLQHLLACTRDETYRDAIICKLEGKFSELSQHKFASNVVESCLLHGNVQQRRTVIFEVLGMSQGGDFNESLFNMMKHEYGNYVVQTMIDCADAGLKNLIVGTLSPYLESLRSYKGARFVLSKFSHHLKNQIA